MAKKKTFDESLQLLIEIVEKLEKEELPLEEALSLYKEGAKLTNVCKEKLNKVEGEILLIQKEMDNWSEKEFSQGE